MIYPHNFTPDVIRTFHMTPTKAVCLRTFAEAKGVRWTMRRKAILQGMAALVKAGYLPKDKVGELWSVAVKRYPRLNPKDRNKGNSK